MRSICLLLIPLLLCACAPREETKGTGMCYATLLTLEEGAGWTYVEVRSPWKNGEALGRYLLADRAEKVAIPDSILARGAQRIAVPVERATVLSSVHAALLFELGAGQRVAALADTDYVMSDTLRCALTDGRIASIGSSMQPDREGMLRTKSEVALVSPYEGSSGPALPHGITAVLCADYMEDTPLGRAEWMRFYGRLVGQGERADSLFEAVRQQYDSIRHCAEAAPEHPRLLCDYVQGGSWPMPGGRSYLASLFADAGARYVFADNDDRGSIFLSLETVLAKGANADVWLLKYGADKDITASTLVDEQPLYARFAALQRGRAYTCNTLRTAYYEEVPFHPDYLLRDVAAICHPQLFPDYSPRYYQPMGQ